ncbi:MULTISPECIES: hypothetical protein [Rhodopseudomonas]|uniref:DUF7662 domain-containing protein n=1 Tax=Rhodopseudomonas TaxID=1073 RepID=UPI0005C90B5A|nr:MULTISPECIES: hypothetical protein [Rhodopseudomonas]MDF3810392.1 hypothetical protein [Rhodopseudomonas sp. BAL398]WOK19314.1 hypothetical protein RBJ75_07305 [Rhodopseudomonas sp. BAL398]
MSKYAALGSFLSKQRTGRVHVSFAEIEKIIGGKLPGSQRYPAWWSNNPMNNPMTRVWLNAGFQTEQVDIAGRKLVFRRVVGPNTKKDDLPAGTMARKSGQHPLIGCMKGTVHLPHGVDLTEPADPGWGELAYGRDMSKWAR